MAHHNHNHGHHDHSRNSENIWGRRLITTMVLNLVIPIAQIYGGIISGSMALISDALHNLSDFTSVAISYAALRIGRRGPTHTQTFGFRRIEVFAALINVVLLYVVAFYIAFESLHRFEKPQPIQGMIVIYLATAAFAANLLSTLMLRPGSKENINIRSAFVHMLTDTLTSLAVILLGVIWIYKPWYWLDPVFSLLIVAMILYSGWDILKRALSILMDAVPPGIDLLEIQREVEAVEGVDGVHHLHVWNISAESIALAGHIIVPDQMLGEVDCIAARIRDLLHDRFQIDHPVLQFETGKYENVGLLCRHGKDGNSACG
jgi:cobalt-zinc-cadmium efflux system protein